MSLSRSLKSLSERTGFEPFSTRFALSERFDMTSMNSLSSGKRVGAHSSFAYSRPASTSSMTFGRFVDLILSSLSTKPDRGRSVRAVAEEAKTNP